MDNFSSISCETRNNYDKKILLEKDRVEIVHFIGGG